MKVGGMNTKKANRFMELEGLRGIAAIVVVIYHAILMFYPGIAYGNHPVLAPVQNMRFEDNLYGNPINVFLSGGFAVAIFFVLSGFVLSIGFLQTGKESIVKRIAAKRYLRLMIPALVSVLIAFFIIASGLSSSKEAAAAISQSGSLTNTWAMNPDFFVALKEGAIGAFMQSGSAYNGVLWTMYYEFVGSFMVFITLLVFGASKYRWFAYGGLLVATFGTWFFAVILGMVLADAYNKGYLRKIFSRRWLSLIALGGGLLLGGYPILSPIGTFYERFQLPGMSDEQNAAIYMSIGALLVVSCVLIMPSMIRFFSHPKVSIVGKYTYSLYLTHTLVLFTVCSAIFVLLSKYTDLNVAVLLAFVATIPIIVLVAYVFHRYVDQPSIALSNYFSDLCFGKRSLDLREQFNYGRRIGYEYSARLRQAGVINLRYRVDENEVE